jgi:hypothetical protein
MNLLIPAAALQTGLAVGGFVYVVLNTCGEVSGLFVSKFALCSSSLVGGVTGVVFGTVAGTISASVVQTIADGYFVPAVKTGSRLTSLGIAAGAGIAAVAVVSLLCVGGHYVIESIKAARRQEVTPIDYLILTDGDFSVVMLESVLGNPEGVQSGGEKN